MPKIKIHNRTSLNLNLSLSHLVPIHFQNNLKPQETWEIKVGSVCRFTFECRQDEFNNRFSTIKSAQTIGLITITGATIGLVAIPLTVLGLAPIVGPSTVLAHLATNSFIVSAATPQVLGLTSWLASTFAKKTVYTLATERGIKEDELEETLKISSMVIDSIKYLTLSKSLIDLNQFGKVKNQKDKMVLKNKEFGVMGIMSCGTGDFLEVGCNWLKNKLEGDENGWIENMNYRMIEERNEENPNPNPNQDESESEFEESWTLIEKTKPDSPMPSSETFFKYGLVRGVYIGFGDDYEFEWREKISDDGNGKGKGNLYGFELWDLKSGSVLG
ncbi:uncharacterized protein MELLADRAFT_85510 [Melampsora larici-populina 98AG31]|uniref:Uncharacterized protein n=1 Tax=Melampsora larici-populina (strain 98AG31 / pathotype 3-4-7) TaxID=747676 RepID=F4RIZ1_MELLP|nr:uncharacterized protein MELLADRAFT_85510 [Melampsora larici-populina 98AG31]EGG07746.1 hypothetical protein MELLADRAFT_85510 [Melampsora larici-populina 98AG31]